MLNFVGTHCIGFPEPPDSSNFNESAIEYSFDNAEMYMGKPTESKSIDNVKVY